MEIIIKIPKEIYTGEQTTGILPIVVDAIGKGIPLPEHHGRIIDESKITSVYYHEETYNRSTVSYRHTVIDRTDAPTIIEGSESE